MRPWTRCNMDYETRSMARTMIDRTMIDLLSSHGRSIIYTAMYVLSHATKYSEYSGSLIDRL